MSDTLATPAVNTGIFSNPLVAIALPKITAALAGALGTYAAVAPDQAGQLASAIVGGALAVFSAIWSYYKHKNTKAVVAAVAVSPAAAAALTPSK